MHWVYVMVYMSHVDKNDMVQTGYNYIVMTDSNFL